MSDLRKALGWSPIPGIVLFCNNMSKNRHCYIFQVPNISFWKCTLPSLRWPLDPPLGLDSLVDRIYKADVNFLNKLLTGIVDCLPLLFKIYFRIPSRCTRIKLTFFSPYRATNYECNEPIYRILSLANKNPNFSLL